MLTDEYYAFVLPRMPHMSNHHAQAGAGYGQVLELGFHLLFRDLVDPLPDTFLLELLSLINDVQGRVYNGHPGQNLL